MGQVATLSRYEKNELDFFRKNKRFSEGSIIDSLYVDKLWEPIMFVFSDGNFKNPFTNIFMPASKIFLTEEEEIWSEHIKYHSNEEIKEMNLKMKDITAEVARERIDIERMNKTVIYPIKTDQIPSLIDQVMNVKIFFSETKENQIIVGYIG